MGGWLVVLSILQLLWRAGLSLDCWPRKKLLEEQGFLGGALFKSGGWVTLLTQSKAPSEYSQQEMG